MDEYSDRGIDRFLRMGREREDNRAPMSRRNVQPDDFCVCGHRWREHADVTLAAFEKLCKVVIRDASPNIEATHCYCKGFKFRDGLDKEKLEVMKQISTIMEKGQDVTLQDLAEILLRESVDVVGLNRPSSSSLTNPDQSPTQVEPAPIEGRARRARDDEEV